MKRIFIVFILICLILFLNSCKENDKPVLIKYEINEGILLESECVWNKKEDLIETYLLQKKRNAIVEYYGLREENVIQGMRLVRPLLGYTKKELEDYCLDNNLLFGVDETNFDLSYTRNRIRCEIINKMTSSQVEKILEEIRNVNEIRQDYLRNLEIIRKKCSNEKGQIIISNFLKLKENIQKKFYIISL